MNTEPANVPAPSPRALFIAALVAIGIAVVILFSVILPAEFAYDPFRIGRLLGITGLSQAQDQPLEEQLQSYSSDYVEFYLEPFQSVEYKYSMDLDAPLVFSWEADAELYYDMHAEPAGLGGEFAESYEQGTASNRSGAYHAPFTGIHGWFWENRSLRDVEVRLYAAGFFVGSTVFSGSVEYDRELKPVTELNQPAVQ
ncbi:MAG: hypothetical protein R3F41_12400 [Gammaproteobacteria bacterium]|nr:hypothetical protein [Pseudomonadales bacterium]MCP5348897.1 hypothetical protein [Pseudomonadales bacterium]